MKFLDAILNTIKRYPDRYGTEISKFLHSAQNNLQTQSGCKFVFRYCVLCRNLRNWNQYLSGRYPEDLQMHKQLEISLPVKIPEGQIRN